MRTLTGLACAALTVAAHADITSTFDHDAEGWRAANVDTSTLAITYQDPTWDAGQIEATEFGRGVFLLAAPTTYLGDLSPYVGGSVSFRLSDTSADASPHPALIIQGAGALMYYDAPGPGTSLTSFSVPLTASAWKIGLFGEGDPAPTATQFRAILSNVTQFGINADWTTSTIDKVALDDVHVAPVPEPATLAAFGFGLATTIRRRKRR